MKASEGKLVPLCQLGEGVPLEIRVPVGLGLIEEVNEELAHSGQVVAVRVSHDLGLLGIREVVDASVIPGAWHLRGRWHVGESGPVVVHKERCLIVLGARSLGLGVGIHAVQEIHAGLWSGVVGGGWWWHAHGGWVWW